MELGLHIAIISNIIFEPYFVPLTKRLFGENTVILPIPFGEHTEDKYQTQLRSADLIVVWLNIEALLPGQFYSLAKQDLDETIALCKKLYADLTSIYGFCLRFMPHRCLWQSVICTMILLTS
mgnify:CR=1 FL=1